MLPGRVLWHTVKVKYNLGNRCVFKNNVYKQLQCVFRGINANIWRKNRLSAAAPLGHLRLERLSCRTWTNNPSKACVPSVWNSICKYPHSWKSVGGNTFVVVFSSLPWYYLRNWPTTQSRLWTCKSVASQRWVISEGIPFPHYPPYFIRKIRIYIFLT